MLSLRKVRECRRCSQQYRTPMPVLLCLALLLIGGGMIVPMGLRFQMVGLTPAIFSPLWPLVLAGAGVPLVLVGFVKLVFGRGVRPPERQDWRDRKEPMPPAVPRGFTGVSIATVGVTAAPLTEPAGTVGATAPSLPRRPADPAPKTIASAVAIHSASAVRSGGSAGDGPMPAGAVLAALRRGTVIPAHPLALNSHREFDPRRTAALTRYYLASGAGGLAVGVHTTQFAIRKPKFNLLRPVLELVRKEIHKHEETTGKPIVKVAGVCGPTKQAVAEAQLAAELGYDMGLLNLGGLPAEATEFDLISHCRKVAEHLPLFGFFLNPALGGRPLPYGFWRAFAEIPNVVAIKIAPFNRYQTQDVLRAIAESGRALMPHENGKAAANNPIALYTGNDDTIISDLLGDWTYDVDGKPITQRIVGGLLGHWACWTRAAVDTFESIRAVNQNGSMPAEASVLARQVTDMNGAIFDAANGFRGSIPGVLEVLRRQGLIEGNWCLDINETLSPGQAEEITRVSNAYPHLTDDDFVREHRDEWLK